MGECATLDGHTDGPAACQVKSDNVKLTSSYVHVSVCVSVSSDLCPSPSVSFFVRPSVRCRRLVNTA